MIYDSVAPLTDRERRSNSAKSLCFMLSAEVSLTRSVNERMRAASETSTCLPTSGYC